MSKTLTQYIREIAEEPAENGEGTQAEVLAREMWRIAQGYDEELTSGKIKKHPPNRAMMTTIMDRLEGKAAIKDMKDDKRKATIADKVEEQSRKRLNALAKQTGSSN